MLSTPNFSKIDNLLAATYRDDEFPVCYSQTKEWSKSRPFENLTILDATPIFRNTLVKHRALVAAGARLIVGKAQGLPYDESIVKLLQESGIQVVSYKDEQTEPVDVILDCAASFIHWNPRLGAVELTQSGVPKYASRKTAVFVADSGRIKKIETCLGTGESYFRAMKQLGYADWRNKKIVIFGSGKVGFGLLSYAVANGANATVVTNLESVTENVRKLASEIIDCEDIPSVVSAIKDAYAVVTATGIAGALSQPTIIKELINSQALLANMGVEDEYGETMPSERVLMNKSTLNFILEEPTHLKYIDATMGLHNEGINFLLSHPSEKGLIEPPLELEEQLLQLTRMNGSIGDEINLI